MTESIDLSFNAARLRLGIALIFFFWIPLWLVAPFIADEFSWNTQYVTLAIMTLQGVVGVIGAIIAGKPAVAIVKATPRRKVLKTFWHVLRTGKFQKI